jgi:hypothetical protein
MPGLRTSGDSHNSPLGERALVALLVILLLLVVARAVGCGH